MRNKSLIAISLIVFAILVVASCNSDKKDANKKNDLKNIATATSKDSIAFYENILSSDSLNTELRLALATNYYAERKFEEAIYHLLIVNRIDKKNLEALITLGNVYYDAEQNEKAIEFYEKALVFDNNNVNVRCDLATCYHNIKNSEKAINLLKKNLSIDKNHAQTHHNLSIIYKDLGKKKESEEELKIYQELNK